MFAFVNVVNATLRETTRTADTEVDRTVQRTQIKGRKPWSKA